MRFCVKKSAEALKLHKGKEPTVNLVRQHCTKAAVNPDTGEYFDKKLILDVFKNECFDTGARLPWGHLLVARLTLCVIPRSDRVAPQVCESRKGRFSPSSQPLR